MNVKHDLVLFKGSTSFGAPMVVLLKRGLPLCPFSSNNSFFLLPQSMAGGVAMRQRPENEKDTLRNDTTDAATLYTFVSFVLFGMPSTGFTAFTISANINNLVWNVDSMKISKFSPYWLKLFIYIKK